MAEKIWYQHISWTTGIDELVIGADGAIGLDDVLDFERDDGGTSGARISRLGVA